MDPSRGRRRVRNGTELVVKSILGIDDLRPARRKDVADRALDRYHVARVEERIDLARDGEIADVDCGRVERQLRLRVLYVAGRRRRTAGWNATVWGTDQD